MAEVQKQLAWTTPPPGKVSSEVVGNDILTMLASMVTGRAGQVKPVDIKDGEYWTKIASDGSPTKYRWTLADADGDGTPEQTLLGGSIAAKIGGFPIAIDDGEGNPAYDQTVLDALGITSLASTDLSNLTSDALSNAKIMPVFTDKKDGSVGSRAIMDANGTSASPASFTLPNYGTWLCTYMMRGETLYYLSQTVSAGGTTIKNNFYYAAIYGSAFRIA